MHISEGILSMPVLLAGAAGAAIGVGVGLRQLRQENLMTVALFSAAFFAISLLHIDMGPSCVHLVLNGLMGLVLGWAAFPAIFIASLLQGVLFQMGGLTTLGVNTCIMGIPAVLCYYIGRPLLLHCSHKGFRVIVFCCGALTAMLSALVLSGLLYLSGEEFIVSAVVLLAVHVLISLLDGGVTLITVLFILKARPALLGTSFPASGYDEV